MRDARVRAALQSFVTVRYEHGHAAANAVIDRFGVHGFPTLLVLGPDGAEWDEVARADADGLVADLERIRRGEETLPVLRKRLEADPADTEAAVALAERLSQRRPEAAVDLCRQVMARLDPSQRESIASLLLTQGQAETSRGGHDAALALIDRIVTEYPDTRAAAVVGWLLGNCVPAEDPERMLALLEKALPLVDEDQRESLEFTRASLHHEAAARAWLRIGERAGEDPDLLNMAAWECFLRGWNTPQAIGWAREAVALSGRAPHVLDTLANLLFRAGELDEAVQLQAEAVGKAGEGAGRDELEENLVKFLAVRKLRAERARSEAPMPR